VRIVCDHDREVVTWEEDEAYGRTICG